VLLCVETGREPGADELAIAAERPTLVVRTKVDLDGTTATEGVRVSVVTGEGLDALRRAVAERVFADRIALADLEPALTRARHRTALARARGALAGALEQFRGSGDAVLVAHHVREATTALDELVGAVDVEDVLDRVFANFCVGK
jgi:tRNA modification GTPase